MGLAARLESLGPVGRNIVLALLMAVFFAMIGPFGSFAQPWPQRFATCLAYSFSSVLIWGPGYPWLLRAATRLGGPPLLVRLACGLLISAPVALTAVLVARFILRAPSLPNVLIVYTQVAAIAVPLALLHYAVQQWGAGRAAAAAAAPAPPRILERLPAALGPEIVALEAEDHYVRVHTARGSVLILMRFADAIAELDGLRGLRVHRSWWVARAAVTGAAKAGRRAELKLSNGLSVPVSRAAMAEARADGLLGVRA